MKSTIIVMFTAGLLLSVSVYAQRGSHGGMGPGVSAMSHGNSATHGNSASANDSTTRKGPATIPTNLASKLDNILKPTGMTAQQYCSTGFKNLGQCVAAIHVSQNLHINPLCLKSDMTKTDPPANTCPLGTGSTRMSLGKAIRTLEPTADASAAVSKANKQAQADLKNSGKS